jgi:ELWxxDGT repeat protein
MTPTQARLLLVLLALAGTAAAQGPPALVRDINTRQLAQAENLTSFGGKLYFRLTQGAEAGLWQSDGTSAGTARVHEGYVDSPVVSGGHLFFVAASPIPNRGASLWATDGQGPPFEALGNQPFGVGPLEPTDVGGTLFFVLQNGIANWSLWKSDGTAVGTVQVALLPVPLDPPRNLTPVGGALFFAIGFGPDSELWTSNGTEAGTKKLQGGEGGQFRFHGLFDLTAAAGRLFYVNADGAVLLELWASDGTDTEKLATLSPGLYVQSPTAAGDLLYFAVPGGGSYRVWRSDGTVAGTRALERSFISVGGFVRAEGVTVFRAADEQGDAYWVTDGTDAGTHRLEGLVPAIAGGAPGLLQPPEEILVVAADAAGSPWAERSSSPPSKQTAKPRYR